MLPRARARVQMKKDSGAAPDGRCAQRTWSCLPLGSLARIGVAANDAVQLIGGTEYTACVKHVGSLRNLVPEAQPRETRHEPFGVAVTLLELVMTMPVSGSNGCWSSGSFEVLLGSSICSPSDLPFSLEAIRMKP